MSVDGSTSVGATAAAAPGRPKQGTAPSGGSAAHEVASVGAKYVGRFAPSPTGPLHAGSLVAALASWLDARAHGGQWLVRMEDVDTPRCLPGMDRVILQQLERCGLHPDAPPVWQSQRSALYQQALDLLVARELAYPCVCSRKDIEAALSRLGQGRTRHGELIYPGTCRPGVAGRVARTTEADETGRAWRLRTDFFTSNRPTAPVYRSQAATESIAKTIIHWTDRRLGPQQQDVQSDVGDFVLKRADGYFAYQLAVVVDDAAQGVTDVVRGEDLADNTARQILLQQYLGLPTPRYLHTPLVLGANLEKLSKQNGAQSIDTIDPLAALNSAARVLGLPEHRGSVAGALEAWTECWYFSPTHSPPPLSRPAGRERGASFGRVFKGAKYSRNGSLGRAQSVTSGASLQSVTVNDTNQTAPSPAIPTSARSPRIRGSMPEGVAYPKEIKSFVRRAGRITTGQTKAFEDLGPKFLLPYQAGAIDFVAAYAGATGAGGQNDLKNRPVILEIGFGMGEATAHIATLMPEKNFLCCEVHEPGVGALLKRIGEQGLHNIRIVAHDAVEVIDNMLPLQSLDGVHIFFPDPWHKKKHNKRRLIQSPLIAKLAARLKPGGYLHCATDWQPYAEQILEVLSAEPLLKNTATLTHPELAGYAPKPHYRPLTKFENRGIKLGHGVWDVVFERV